MRDFKKLAQTALEAAEEKKAINPLLLDLGENSDVANYLVIVTAESSTQMGAIAEEVEMALDLAGVRLLRREGRPGLRWLVLDYGGFVMHILTSEAREFFRLEQLWEEARTLSKPEKPKKSKKPRVAKPKLKIEKKKKKK